MRRLIPILLILTAFAACDRAPQEQTPERRRLAGEAKGWNVVLLTVDTLRADRLGAYGYNPRTAHPNSPRIDAQLGSGVVFEQAQSQRASTWPSLASLLTGLYPSGHGVAENGYGFPDDLPTLPKLLQGAGYQTGAFLSNMCDANHQGWDAFACAGGQDGKSVRRAARMGSGLISGTATASPSSSGSTCSAPIRPTTTAATWPGSWTPATPARSAPRSGSSTR